MIKRMFLTILLCVVNQINFYEYFYVNDKVLWKRYHEYCSVITCIYYCYQSFVWCFLLDAVEHHVAVTVVYMWSIILSIVAVRERHADTSLLTLLPTRITTTDTILNFNTVDLAYRPDSVADTKRNLMNKTMILGKL
jgi:hypothetical protein